MSFPRYPKYKDSGVEWLGEVPEGWEVKRLKHNLRLLTEKTDRRSNPVALENIEGWSGRFVPTETEFQGDGVAFDAGDLLFGKLRPYLAKAYLAESSGEAVGDFHVMRPVGIDGRFAQYQLLNRGFIDIVDGSTFGAKMPRASWEFVSGMDMPTPPRPEQTAIAAFLDRETAKIDGLVAEQRRLMELLKEKRQAVISHAVTKGLSAIASAKAGLNPDLSAVASAKEDTPMKPSGIEWLGDVPEHWRVGKCGFYLTVLSGFAFPSAGFTHDENDTKLLRGINVGVAKIRWKEAVYWQRSEGDGLDSYEMKVGDLVIGMDRPLIGAGVRVAMISEEDLPCLLLQRVASLTPSELVNSDYLLHLLSSDMFEAHFMPDTTGVSVPHISPTQISDFVIPIPPREEQDEIAEYITSELGRFDTLTAEAQRAIDLLQERRTALISAAVTGQIDVRKLNKEEAA